MTFEHIHSPAVLDKIAIEWLRKAAEWESMHEPLIAANCEQNAANALARAQELRGKK